MLLAAAMALAACTESDLSLGSGDPGDPDPSVAPGAATADDTVAVALGDLEQYWSARLPGVYGVAFEPLEEEIAYGPSGPFPECGDEALEYEDIAENALYCPIEDIIAWDRVGLIPGLQEQFGPLTVGIVMAHEYAHAIQARGGVDGPTVDLELQADCFAGAWVADAEDRIPLFATDGGALDDAIGGFLELRDTVGVSGRDPAAHGSGFDRVSAFQEGYESGNDVCAGYEEDPPDVVAIPFTSRQDFAQGGNLPIDQLIEPLTADLDSFYTALFDQIGGPRWRSIEGPVPVNPETGRLECGDETFEGVELRFLSIYCVDDATIYMDELDLLGSLNQIGDFAFGGEVARNYAFAAQIQLGLFAPGEAGAELHADCLTGVFAAAEFLQEIPRQQLILSPGDLDEILIAFLTIGDRGSLGRGGDDEASAFDRTTAFRSGFVDGVPGCDAYVTR